ncbi:MAG TPA: hypothetical protein VFD58_32305 [Blastocatellia bacterium]|nr:hypothetical protein [Blastocatellia bacterium]
MTTRFIITGNQENKTGNPIPYFRQTQQSSRFNPAARRYHDWKDFVRAQFWLQTAKKLRTDKPYGKAAKGRLEVKIRFRGEAHADPDNIVKGLLDSLFENDKHIDVSTSHSCGNQAGSIEILITLTNETSSP